MYPNRETEALEQMARETGLRSLLDKPWKSRDQIAKRFRELAEAGKANGRMAGWAIERFFRQAIRNEKQCTDSKR